MGIAVSTRDGEDRLNPKKENPLLQSRPLLLLLGFFLFVLILAFVFGDRGIVEILKTQKEIRSLQRTIRELEAEKAKLTREIEALRDNPLALEKKARQELWLMKKNEKVVVLLPKEKEKSDE